MGVRRWEGGRSEQALGSDGKWGGTGGRREGGREGGRGEARGFGVNARSKNKKDRQSPIMDKDTLEVIAFAICTSFF